MNFVLVGDFRKVKKFINQRGNSSVVGLSPDEFRRFDEDQFVFSDTDYFFNIFSPVIISDRFIKAFENRIFNIHNGMLPYYRGINVHQWAIRNGDNTTAVCVHHISSVIDGGDVVKVRTLDIRPHDTGLSLYQKTHKAGIELVLDTISDILDGKKLHRIRQDHCVGSYYSKSAAVNGEIDWNQPAFNLRNFIRAGNYYPLKSPSYTAYIKTQDGVRIEVFSAEVRSERGNVGELIRLENGLPLVGCSQGSLLLTKFKYNNNYLNWNKVLGAC